MRRTLHQKVTQTDMQKDRRAFESRIDSEAEKVNREIELRTRELLRVRDEREEEKKAEERR